ncbi:hypothetical protein OV203_22395 [Nannocystis sp. ILAH1]|uniref:hypothetical protein n=1 Tax=unclassified Nannocystis TaxID=2627009 RepID=UPI00226E4667|nr:MULTISPECIES: hypothetical protein [unclassified Nannocystis]MCY0989906.1 hypothetical protein [Nannocystis sp. ILAH1]MCY1071058.1 hypothetical protein [Nannocystis sp. RBIL2]
MHNHRALRGLACALSLLLACTDKGGDTTEETGTEGTQTTDAATTDAQTTETQPTDAQTTDVETGAPVAGCECADGDPCSVELCETASLVEDEDTGGQDETQLELALTCALEALRDRKVGHIGWHVRSGAGQIDEHGHFEMFGDGTARSTRGGVADLCEWIVDDVTVVTLKDPSVFAGCLTEPAIEKRFSCLRQAELDYQSTCVEGETDCSGV